MKCITRFFLFFILSFVLIQSPIVQNNAYAGMISTQTVVDGLSLDKNKISDFMKRDDVKAQFVKLGVSPAEAESRLAGLSDSEVRRLSTQIDQAQAGAGIGGLLVVVLLVILIIYFVKRI